MTPHILTQDALNIAVNAQATGILAEQVLTKLEAANTAMGDLETTLRNERNTEDAKHTHMPWLDRPNTSAIIAKGPFGTSACCALLEKLDWPYLLLQDIGDNHPIWGDGAVLHNIVLSDGSFLLFENHTLVHAEETGEKAFVLQNGLTGTATDVASGLAAVLHNTLELTETEDSLVVDLRDTYQDADDPPIDENESYQEWSHEDAEKARTLAMTAFVFLAQSDKACAEISMEGADGDGIQVHSGEHVDLDKLKILLNHVLDPDSFEGYTFEYNDQAYGRRSGYNKDCTVFWDEFTLDSLSAHQIMDMKATAQTLFKEVL